MAAAFVTFGVLWADARGVYPSRWRGGLVFGILAGLAVFSSRIAILPLVAYGLYGATRHLSAKQLWKKIQTAWSHSSPHFRWFVAVSLGAFLYLEILGPEIGKFQGKPIRVHATPWLNLVAAVVAIQLGRSYWPFRPRTIGLGASVALGFAIGFAPEWLHFLRLNQGLPESITSNRDFAGMLATLGSVPRTLSLIVASGDSPLRWVSDLAWIGGGSIGLVLAWRSGGSPLPLMILLLQVFAYCRLNTYAGASPRYLLLAWIPLTLGLATLIARGLRVSRNFRNVPAAALLVILTLASWHSERMWMTQATHAPTGENRVELALRVVDWARSHGLRYVFAEHHWLTNHFTFFSRISTPSSPALFATSDPGLLGPGYEAHENASDAVIGLLADQSSAFAPGNRVKLFGRDRVVIRFDRLPGTHYFVGEAK